MFTRIVKMKFEPEHVAKFLSNFDLVKHKIRRFPGCCHLDLLRDKEDDTIFFTYSKWDSPDDLEKYRNSNLFKGVWATTKPMFSAKAEAWSVTTQNVAI